MTSPIVPNNSDGEIESEYRKLGLNGFPYSIAPDLKGKVEKNICLQKPDQISVRRHKLEMPHQAVHGK